LPVKDWVQKVTVASDITLRSRLVTFLLSAYGGLLVGTMALFFLRGFRMAGFHFEEATMHWLRGPVIMIARAISAAVSLVNASASANTNR
jgi:hypothetical protein